MDKNDQYIETQKVVFEYLKHLTTLNTGSIVLLTVLLEKLFQKPEWKELIGATFISFVFSLLSLSLSSFGVIRSIRTPNEVTKGIIRFTSWSFIAGLFSFVLGMVFLSVFSIKNWF